MRLSHSGSFTFHSVNLVHFRPEWRNGTQFKQNEIKGMMNEMRLSHSGFPQKLVLFVSVHYHSPNSKNSTLSITPEHSV